MSAVTASAPVTELPTTAFLAKHLRENIWFYLVLIIGGLLMIAPFVWMVSTALKPAADQFTRDLIPRQITFENFSKAWELMEFQHLVWNSFRIAALSTIGQVVTCSMGAFVFAIVRFRGRDLLFLVLLATLMVPYQMTVIPQFLIFKTFGLYGTDVPLYLPSFLGGAFGVFLLRQYFRTIPLELLEVGEREKVGDLPAIVLAAWQEPTLDSFDDLQELLLLDPVHDVTEAGWPHRPDDQA